MNMRRWSLVLCLVLGFGVFALFYAHAAQAKPIELSYSNFFPPTHIQAKLGDSWAKEIEKRTNGKVKITYYPGGALLKGPKIYDGILKSITDIGMSVFGYSRGVFPSMEAIDLTLPLGYCRGNVYLERTPGSIIDNTNYMG